MFKVGDKITIAGANRMVPNPDRRRWQFWKPRMVDAGEPAVFEVDYLGKSFVSPKLFNTIWPDGI